MSDTINLSSNHIYRPPPPTTPATAGLFSPGGAAPRYRPISWTEWYKARLDGNYAGELDCSHLFPLVSDVAHALGIRSFWPDTRCATLLACCSLSDLGEEVQITWYRIEGAGESSKDAAAQEPAQHKAGVASSRLPVVAA